MNQSVCFEHPTEMCLTWVLHASPFKYFANLIKDIVWKHLMKKLNELHYSCKTSRTISDNYTAHH